MKLITLITGMFFLIGGIGYGQQDEPESAVESSQSATANLAEAPLYNSEKERVGIATLMEAPEGVRVSVQAYNLTPGLHGFHIHEVGECNTPDYKSAGGHFNPYGNKHGLKDPKGPHAGDMYNLLVGPEGTATAVMIAPLATLGSGANSLFDQNGSAIVIHSGPDDYRTDPAGDAGDRIACGVITKITK
ncbi:MAG TPA: superoxide dismutase family protein [Thermodesulfobacteriota bacterium]|nr:superoxide dismutase family protein [Thermodesulfobacteriota bacterium]